MTGPLEIPDTRRHGLRSLLENLARANSIILTTHVNADGDGAGSEAAVAAWLASAGKSCAIINPTPFPDVYRFLLPDADTALPVGDPLAIEALEAADAFFVLDTAEPSRLGRLPKLFRDRPVLTLDHHPPADTTLQGLLLQDPTACATGELVYDLLQLALGPDATWPELAVQGIYTAIVTDTGSFRFANTTSRTHFIAGDLLRRGVDPEAIYRRIFATVPLRRIEILRASLGALEVDPELPLTWISIPTEVSRSLNPTAEDAEGLVEYARSIQGTELAILFRETADGATKVSFRSSGDTDVNALARQFGGGGHVKASGAIISAPIATAKRQVLEAARAALRATLGPPDQEQP